MITFLIFGLNFNRTSFDDPIAQGSDDAEPLTGEVRHGHDGGEATGPSFEAIVDRFKSLDEVRKAIKAEGLEECGLIFGKFFELFKRLPDSIGYSIRIAGYYAQLSISYPNRCRYCLFMVVTEASIWMS